MNDWHVIKLVPVPDDAPDSCWYNGQRVRLGDEYTDAVGDAPVADLTRYFQGWSDAKAGRQYGEGRRQNDQLRDLEAVAAAAWDLGPISDGRA